MRPLRWRGTNGKILRVWSLCHSSTHTFFILYCSCVILYQNNINFSRTRFKTIFEPQDTMKHINELATYTERHVCVTKKNQSILPQRTSKLQSRDQPDTPNHTSLLIFFSLRYCTKKGYDPRDACNSEPRCNY